ncbi:MAG TPA: ATP-binding protein [Herpetosiphonaceae bacterium]|nr:ATP-binding protein [Herpetosiphonaceae bacterium]
MSTNSPLTLDRLHALAPDSLHSYRASRYFGDDNSVVLADFAPASQQSLRQLYAALLELLALTSQHKDRPLPLDVLKTTLEAVGWSATLKQLQELEGNPDRAPAPHLDEVIHDVRGGSCMALALNLQLLQLGIGEAEDSLRAFFMTRDHLKIMRNAIRDIDAARYQADWEQKLHNVRLIVEKWSDSVYQIHNSAATILVDCRFDGNISERCLEFSALDRVLYNLVNNAVRHTADDQVHIVIFPLGGEHPRDVRFVIYNAISSEHGRLLAERFGDRIDQLFAGGFTTGGTGLGMSICAQFIVNAYGLQDTEQALAERYLGATLIDDWFVSWFHWPVAAD